MKKFSQLVNQDKFEARNRVYKKVSSDLAADVRFSGDACVERFSGNEEVDPLDDDQAEARVKELAEEREKAEESESVLTEDETQKPDAAAIRKMKRDELDELAERNEISIEGFNVEESREYLIAELCGEEAKS